MMIRGIQSAKLNVILNSNEFDLQGMDRFI